jgi:hypothetical protein
VTAPTRLTWPNCLNVRDLGGLPTSDGRQIGSGALIRSDNLSRLTGGRRPNRAGIFCEPHHRRTDRPGVRR